MNILPTMPNSNNEAKGLKAVLPYWPVIAFCIMCLTSLGGIMVKLDYISKAVDKNEVQFSALTQQIATQNDRQNLTSQAIIEIRGVNERQSLDIARIDKHLTELRSDRRDSRWIPK